ncbi:uncharacterized protein LAESUDRAFT_471873 [Laetiporus sulphureus 93-53]|uniref:Uncharacterized protein n=1 Tax=Laetiporus sulphureus 93-53 TaxID=1314785 RepID=A0A165GAU6_9APHY|nr:uncharacterized protein LAESUDRAFT_471873 [Laetiporus sulphureus 93-53]KZT10086.1 hypothetical protein LAESUDRAFT_471873 [Laetiporus sulphureus 93-53]
MTSVIEAQVSTELKKTLCAMQEYYSDECAGNAEEQLRLAYALPERIRAQQERILQERSAVQDAQAQIHQLVTEINEIHPRLQEQLVEALTTLPPLLNETRATQADVLSATIEASLLKLSLIRTRAYNALYGYISRSDPDCTMNNALLAAHEKLFAKQREQEEEERALDARIAEYDNLMLLVGGGEGGFAQIVEDMARVKKETEECRRDLCRLGWTGD